MNDRNQMAFLTLSIAAVERDTGLSKDTLRVWERRYGFPNPTRDGGGSERAYPLEQVEKLRLVKRLLDAGHRPGRVVGLSQQALQQLADTTTGPAPVALAPDWDDAAVQDYLSLLRAHDAPTLRQRLTLDLARFGLPRFIDGLAVPLMRAVGEAWLRGQMAVYEEHACTEALQTVLRQALGNLPAPADDARPRVLLSTLPGEPHGLALLMVEAHLACEGAACISLGVQTPVWDLVQAAAAYRSDIVALGFTGCSNPNHTVDALQELRAKLPAGAEVWVGGNAPVLQRRRVQGVQPLDEFSALPEAVAVWRARHP